jgi:CRP-like cAMP-binding protein
MDASAFDENIAAFGDFVPEQVYPPGVELFLQDSTPEEVYYIKSGLIKLSNMTKEGRELIVGLRSAGSILGVASVMLDRPHPLTAVTLTRCRIRRISAPLFLNHVRSDIGLSWQLHRLQSQELYDQVAQLVRIGTLPAQQRLEQFLAGLISALEIKEAQKEAKIQWPLKHWEIAQLIAITPEHLSRILRQMEREGLIRRKKGWIIVPDLKRLSHSTIT